MRPPRGLSAEEAKAWAKLAETVTPFEGREASDSDISGTSEGAGGNRSAAQHPAEATGFPVPLTEPLRRREHRPAMSPREFLPQSSDGHGMAGLDSHWERRFKAGTLSPDLTLDLHGHSLDRAYDRLMGGIAQARAMDARLVLIVTGRARPVEAADRGARRGAIRAKILDWLAASDFGNDIVSVRRAHRRHGGDGALYLVLRRRR